MKLRLPIVFAVTFAVSSVFFGSSVKPETPTRDEATNVVLQWNNAALEAIRATRTNGQVSSRALAILNTGMYDAWAAYDPRAVSTMLGDTLQRPKHEITLDNKNKAMSYAAYQTLVDLFPSETPRFDQLMTNLGYDPTDTSTDVKTPTGIGNVSAQTLIEFRHRDGSNQLGDLNPGAYSDYTGYTPVNTPTTINDPDRWQPQLIPDGQGGFTEQRFSNPHWGLVVPFALTSGSQFRPAPPTKTIAANPEGYRQQAQQVLDASANLTPEQKALAEYWSGNIPGATAGIWNVFAQFVSQRDNHTLDDDIKMFFALANGLSDALIATWDAKAAYDSVRPVTAIRYLFDDQQVLAWGGPNRGTQLIDGGNWQPYLPTAPHPEYVAAQSSLSIAGAYILKKFTGSDAFGYCVTQPAGSSTVENGPANDITFCWNTLSEAAEQGSLSRLYAGWHFEDGLEFGKRLGRQVGVAVWRKSQSYILRKPPRKHVTNQ